MDEPSGTSDVSGDSGGNYEDPGDGDDPASNEGRLTYAEAGVDIAASEAATAALAGALDIDEEGYAGTFTLDDRTFGLTTDGVGTKLLVAEAMADRTTIGIDCIAMNVNDLLAGGLEPLAFVDYLALESPDEALTEEIGRGLARGAEAAGCALVGGETAVLPEVVSGFDLAGAAIGSAPSSDTFPGTAAVGDALVGYASSGIHSNGLTLARQAVTREHEYTDPFPPDPDRSIGEVLLEPTRIYTELLPAFRDHGVRAAAHLTGGGWTNLLRMGRHRYTVESAPDPQPIFRFIQGLGNVRDEEMHRTFNMGTGFVVAVPPSRATRLVERTPGELIGRVEDGGGVRIRGLHLEAA